MAWVRWSQMPSGSPTPPGGVTVSVDGDRTVVVESADASVYAWQRQLVMARQLPVAAIIGCGDGSAEKAGALPTQEQWQAILDARSLTKAALVAAIDAVGA